jgi:chaperonin GroEL
MDLMLPKITNDGVKIANKISLKDQEEDAGAYIIRNVSSQQNDDVGDGTTTVTVLTQAIIHEALKRPESPMLIRKSLQEAAEGVLKKLAKLSIKTKKSDIEKIALISSEDKKIARLIVEIIDKLGEEAVINVEDSKTFSTEYELVDGYEAHVGFMSEHFANNKSGKAVFEDIPVIVADSKISGLAEIVPLSKMLQENNIGKCVIVCSDIDDQMLGLFILNNQQGTLKSVLIRATDWLLHDIEGVTGARAISKTNSITYQNFKKEHLGYAKKVVSNANTTLFVTDGVSSKKYAKFLEMQADNEPNQYTREMIQKRINKLKGKLAVLKIGAATDTDRDYLKDKAEDSVKAVQAALAEGYVEGGGMTLWRLAQDIKPKTIGEEILKEAMTVPFRKIVENAAKNYTDTVLNMPKGLGYNAWSDKYENLIESGVIDPTKVERLALENAVNTASTFITTSTLITDLDEKNNEGK